MTPSAAVSRAFSTAFGFLMAAATLVQADGIAFAVAMLSAVAVLAGTVFRPGATLAVLLAVTAIVISEPSPTLAAFSGLCAAAHLVLRHAAGGVVTATPPTVIAAVLFTFAGLVASLFPLQVPWLPLLAPLVVFAIFVLAIRPFVDWRGRPAR